MTGSLLSILESMLRGLSAQGAVGTLVLMGGAVAAAFAARYLPIKRQKSDHHRHDVLRNGRRKVTENAIEIKGAGWATKLDPLLIERVRARNEAAQARIESDLVEFNSLGDLVGGAIDRLHNKHWVSHSYEGAMQPGVRVKFNLPIQGRLKASPDEMDRISRDVEVYRSTEAMLARHYNRTYDVPGVQYTVNGSEAVRTGNLVDSSKFLDDFLSGYPEGVDEIIKSAGVESYVLAIDWAEQAGSDGFDRRTYTQAYATSPRR
ncbi:hypothetical protein [Nocardiopsis sp. CNR-923]|uniref:hypothetical protein n=1 Tax=Nocardiopsis sp. CNR-923 TaxID=1904965 RepID=UPI00117F0152|nr:hypothetical protein [Nocardiopsis sp. CNR-923]